ncbi:MAG: DUF2059 domain-containing protein [Beijerinckiaceae bacterium]|nr:DUF2059 domain-containing protein [Beijerinckiaceae bacterium]
MLMALEKQAVNLVFCTMCLLGLSFSIRSGMAQQAAPETPASPSSPVPAAPSPSHLAAAKALVVVSGISRSFSIIIPQFLDQIGSSLTQTRPELRSDLNIVLTQLKPEFDKQVDEMVGIAAQIYVKLMSEHELKAAVTFFEGPAGRRYVESQPAFLTEVVTAMQGWQGKISTDLMARVRAEMKKKGHEL